MPQVGQSTSSPACTDALDANGLSFHRGSLQTETVKRELPQNVFDQAKEEFDAKFQFAKKVVPFPPFPECIEKTADGAIRVSGHRVSLYLILDAIFSGMPIDQIRSTYPTIAPQQLWEVILFCIQHAEAMREYYRARKGEEEAEIQSHQNTIPPLAELRALRVRMQNQR